MKTVNIKPVGKHHIEVQLEEIAKYCIAMHAPAHFNTVSKYWHRYSVGRGEEWRGAKGLDSPNHQKQGCTPLRFSGINVICGTAVVELSALTVAFYTVWYTGSLILVCLRTALWQMLTVQGPEVISMCMMVHIKHAHENDRSHSGKFGDGTGVGIHSWRAIYMYYTFLMETRETMEAYVL